MLTRSCTTPAPEDGGSALFERHFDLVIIGGGITGAALAYSAVHARRPLRVALVEQGALASGTSSRSSGLLHGGLRYLGQGRLALVRRLLRGRRAFAHLAPDLVRRAPFILPCGGRGRPGRWLTQIALGVYGLLDRGLRGMGGALTVEGGQPIGRPRFLGAAQARAHEPLLGDVPQGAFGYDELSVNDGALVRALAAGAVRAGAQVATHTRCERLFQQRDRVAGVWLRDQAGARGLVRAAVVVDATGPWSGQLERLLAGPGAADTDGSLRLSRGTHLVLPLARLPLCHTVAFFGRDGRPLFASPRGQEILVGTTEQEHRGGPDQVRATADDVHYLLAALTAAFPDARLRDADITRTFAGVRPLARPGEEDLGQLDRGYRLDWPRAGLLAVRGGKLTLALSAAREALVAIDRRARWLGLPPPSPRSEARLPPLPDADAVAALTSPAVPRRAA